MQLCEGFSEEMTDELRFEGKVTVNYIKDKEKTIQRRFKGMCKGPEMGGRKRPVGREYKNKSST